MKVQLRKITKKDTDKILKWRNSDAVMKNFIIREKLTKKQHINWLETKVKKGDVVQFIANDVCNCVDFASTYLKGIDYKYKKAEFGIFIGEDDYRNKGVGKQITSLTINYAFKTLELNKVYARVLSYNKRSYNMFLKLGFHEDAKLRKDVFINGKFYDVFILSILKEEWINQNN